MGNVLFRGTKFQVDRTAVIPHAIQVVDLRVRHITPDAKLRRNEHVYKNLCPPLALPDIHAWIAFL
jgi:hypothetical protein